MVLIQRQKFKIISSISQKSTKKYALIPLFIFNNMINNKLVFKVNDQCKIELKIPEIRKLFGRAKN